MSVNRGPNADTLKALETAPNMYLVLSPELYILTASDAYLKATETTREAIRGKHIFEAFPDNPDLPDGDDGLQNINASLQTVLKTKKPDIMRIQRYDVRISLTPVNSYRVTGTPVIHRYWMTMSRSPISSSWPTM